MPFTNDYNKLVYNGIDLREYGLFVSGNRTFNAPRKEYDKVSIPGRSGDLVISNGRYSNVPLEYDAILIEDYELNTAALRSILLSPEGYVRIEDGYHPDEYRMGVFEGPLDFDTILLEAGRCTLEFNCMPQRWLKSGEEEFIIESPQTIVNNTMFDARPIFSFKGNGKLSCVIEQGFDYQSFGIDFGQNSSDMECFVDCDKMNCYKEGYDSVDVEREKDSYEIRDAVDGAFCYFSWHIEHLGVDQEGIESAKFCATLQLVSSSIPVEESETGTGVKDLNALTKIKIIPGDDMPVKELWRPNTVVNTIDHPWKTTLDYEKEFTYITNTPNNTKFEFELEFSVSGFDPIKTSGEFVPVSKAIVGANEYLTIDEFPVIHPGKSIITITGNNVTKSSITPRWYIL